MFSFSRFRNRFRNRFREAEAEEPDRLCSICLDPVVSQRNCCVTECGHSFHTSCLLRTNGRCPNCRSELVEVSTPVAVSTTHTRTPRSATNTISNPRIISLIESDADLMDDTELINDVAELMDIVAIFTEAHANFTEFNRSENEYERWVDIINHHYTAEETPQNIGSRQVIEQFWMAYKNKNKTEIEAIAENYYARPIDPEYPFREISWDLYRAFTTLMDRL